MEACSKIPDSCKDQTVCGKVGFPARMLLRQDPGFSGDSGLRDSTKDGFGLKRRWLLFGGLQGQRVRESPRPQMLGVRWCSERPDALTGPQDLLLSLVGFICA